MDGFQPSNELYDSVIDLELEVWPNDVPAFINMTRQDFVAMNLGSVGYSGSVGLYIPTYTLNNYSNLNIDFWRAYKNPQALSVFTEKGPKNHGVGVKCNGNPTSCVDGQYIPRQCRGNSSNCVEVLAYDPTYSIDMLQRLIDGTGLNFTINFLGASNATEYLSNALNQKKNIMFYNWMPSFFVSTKPVTKVLFPANVPFEYYKFSVNRMFPLTSDFPTQLLSKLATPKFLADFPELQSLASQFAIAEGIMRKILQVESLAVSTYDDIACRWVQENKAIWSTWIPKAPQSAENCPKGYGRYNQGSTYQCVVCPSGTYNWKENTTEVCLHCPPNMYCPGGSEVKVRTGEWMSHRTIFSEPVSYVCPFPDVCCQDTACLAGTCAHGHSGPLDCSSGPGLSLLGIVLGSFVVAVVLLFLPYEEVPTVEILFFYFQVAGCIFGSQLEIGGLKFLVPFLAVTTLDIDRVVHDCTLPISGVAKLLFRYLLPCMDVEGQYVVQNAPNVLCYSSNHIPGFCIALAILVLLLGVLPIGLGLFLRKLYLAKRIIYETDDIGNAQKLFQCFYLMFKPDMFFMMPVTIFEKGVVAMIFTLLNNLDEHIQVNVYLVFLCFICSTRIYWQPYHSHMEAFLNREISLGILTLIGFRIYLDVFEATPAIMAQICTMILLPLFLHMIRWLSHNYEKHEGSIKGMASRLAASKLGSPSVSSINEVGIKSPTAVKRSKMGSIEIARPIRSQAIGDKSLNSNSNLSAASTTNLQARAISTNDIKVTRVDNTARDERSVHGDASKKTEEVVSTKDTVSYDLTK
ncbi:hypothetical protein HDU79_011849 [Rhizoclosmatium sp. JEL0117]|nr:hypothetical protein HDU79_011849 [Rhizoclosmatium sp. JEL0117]